MPLPTRRRRFVIIGALGFSCVLFLGALHRQAPDHWFFSQPSSLGTNPTPKTPAPNPDNATAPSLPTTTPFCEGNGCLDGAWTTRSQLFTSIDELKPWTGCPSPASVQRTEAEQDRADAKRLLDVMNWEWKSNGGAMKEWDAAAFVTRLLQSPGGMIIVGDDMSDQYFGSVILLLRRAGINMVLQTTELPYVHSYIFSNEDDNAKQLVERAGVPLGRAQRPILTLIEDSYLVSLDDLKSIAKRLGAIPGYTKWESPFPQSNGWPIFTRNVSTPSSSEKDLYPEDTVLLMNTGNSWCRSYLTLLRPRNRPSDEQTRLTEAYRQMIRIVSNQLKDIRQLSIYYRATTPGHPNCASRPSPYPSSQVAEVSERNVVNRLTRIVASEAERELKQKWDWDLFSVHNDMWRRATVRLEKERGGSKKDMAKWHYVDVWNQTLQRPDAHYNPRDDCLNWCAPSVFDAWTHHIYHILMMNTKGRKIPGQEPDTDMI